VLLYGFTTDSVSGLSLLKHKPTILATQLQKSLLIKAMTSFTKPIAVGDVTIEGVVCDGIRLSNCYTASVDFTDDVGLTGMLLQHVKQYWASGPSMINKQLFRFNTYAPVDRDDRVVATRSQVIESPVNGLFEVRRGAYTVSEVLDYKPVLLAVVAVTFNNVVVESSKLHLNNINVVSYGNVGVSISSEMMIKDYELK
jgi:hypothetical protein